MAYSLSRYEQEVIINFNAEEDTATLYTANPQWIRKLDRLVEQNPEQFEMYRQEKMDGRILHLLINSHLSAYAPSLLSGCTLPFDSPLHWLLYRYCL